MTHTPLSFHLLATCPEEIQEIVCKEIELLGGTAIENLYKAVSFSVDEQSFYRMHLAHRTASQLYWIIKNFTAKTEEMLFSQVARIKWHEIFSNQMSFRVDAQCENQTVFDSIKASKTVRQAIQNSFTYAKQLTPRTEVEDPQVTVAREWPRLQAI